jgi:hypothetical protein
MFEEQPGLGHMKEIARTLIAEAHLSRRVAVLPPLSSNPTHNPRRAGLLNWSDYFDWAALPVIDARWKNLGDFGRFLRQSSPVHVVDHEKKLFSAGGDEGFLIRFFPGPNIFGEWIGRKDTIIPDMLREPLFSDQFPLRIQEQAAEVVAEIGVPVGVIHIRRGDLAGPETEPDAVINYLYSKGAKKSSRLFALTNETAPGYAAQLRSEFPLIVIEHEVACLQRIQKDDPDNYRIFRIGKCLQARHDSLKLGTLRYMRAVTPQPHSFSVCTRIQNLLAKNSPFLRRHITINWLRKHTV